MTEKQPSTEVAVATKYWPAFFLPVVARGTQFAAGEIPLHISLFPPIKERYYRAYGDTLRRQLNILSPFDVTIAGEDEFDDEDKKVLVRHIEESPRLRHIHEELVRVLGRLPHDARYRMPYNPHITVKTSNQLQTGQTIPIGGFSIVQKSSAESWNVIDKVGFKDGQP